MTTLNLQVATSLGDTQMGSITTDSGRAVTTSAVVTGTDVLLAPGSHGTNNEFTAAIRFPSVTVANAATINSASFKMTAGFTYNAGGSVVKFWVGAQADDNAGALTTASGNLNTTARPRSTAATAWTQTSVVLDTEYSVDITAVVQEIVNRAGWASGNAIVILVDTHVDCTNGEWQEYHSYDGSAAKAPKLAIDYTAGGAAKSLLVPQRKHYVVTRRKTV